MIDQAFAKSNEYFKKNDNKNKHFHLIGGGATCWVIWQSTTFLGIILGLSLYPYVYAACRISFSLIGKTYLNLSKSLGNNWFKTFFKVVIPLSIPSILSEPSRLLSRDGYGQNNPQENRQAERQQKKEKWLKERDLKFICPP